MGFGLRHVLPAASDLVAGGANCTPRRCGLPPLFHFLPASGEPIILLGLGRALSGEALSRTGSEQREHSEDPFARSRTAFIHVLSSLLLETALVFGTPALRALHCP